MADTGSTGPSRDRLATAFWDVFDIAGPVLFVVAVSLVAIGVPFAALTYVHRGDPAYEDWLRRGLLLVGASIAARTLVDIVVEPCAEFVDQRLERLERLERLARERGASVSPSTIRWTGSSTVGAMVDGGFTDLNAALEELAEIGCRQPRDTPGAGRHLVISHSQARSRAPAPVRERGAPVSSSTSRRTGSSTVGAVVDGGFTDMNAALEELAGIGCRQPQETAGVGRVS